MTVGAGGGPGGGARPTESRRASHALVLPSRALSDVSLQRHHRAVNAQQFRIWRLEIGRNGAAVFCLRRRDGCAVCAEVSSVGGNADRLLARSAAGTCPRPAVGAPPVRVWGRRPTAAGPRSRSFHVTSHRPQVCPRLTSKLR